MMFLSYVFILFFIPCKSLKCYECSGHISCGQGQTELMVDCSGKCMIYRNQHDGDMIVRRCCTNDCGTEDGLRNYEGRFPAYFCSEDLCNDAVSDENLAGEIIPTTTTSALLSTNNEQQSCYDCTGHYSQCGLDESTVIHGCKACMVYLNTFDDNIVVRRCCTSDCGLSASISDYEGRTTYFCSSDRCNGIGTEAILTGGITFISTLSSTQTTTTVTVQSSFQCYDCSGPDCGKEGSNLIMNCPTCMVFRNPDDQTKIERHCCWWGCPLNSVSTYNGIQAYFCSYDKCNGYGAENILNPPVTTMGSTTTTSTTTTTTYSLSSCTLNCRHGSTPETEAGCFCHCVAKTNGRECENIDCIQPDDNDKDLCIPENRLLCEQSEIFNYKCLHLCEKC